ncbi:MAG: PAS domain-containing protein, partial [Anaerolineales bacterium]|nr:PAS domain-containing protein [Anaerolineales bacterium]
MNLSSLPYLIPLLLAATSAALLAILAWQRRPATGLDVFALFMIAAGVWCAAYAAEIFSESLAAKLFWARVQYLGISTVAAFCFIFCVQYSRRQLQRHQIGFLFIVPLLTITVAWVKPLTPFLWQEIILDNTGPLPMLTFTYGPVFWLIVGYSYLELLASMALLMIMSRRVAAPYHSHLRGLALAAVFPWLGNGLYVTGLVPIPNLDLTPFGFVMTGLVMALSIRQSQLLTVTPIARNRVLEEMRDGMLVWNRRDRLIDLNTTAAALLNLPQQSAIGRPVTELLNGRLAPLQDIYRMTDVQVEIPLHDREQVRYFDARISLLKDPQEEIIGRLLILRDITQRKQVEIDLSHQKELFENLVQVTRSVLKGQTLQEALQGAVDIACNLTGAEKGSLLLLDDNGEVTT